jgi:hypothetical protein
MFIEVGDVDTGQCLNRKQGKKDERGGEGNKAGRGRKEEGWKGMKIE